MIKSINILNLYFLFLSFFLISQISSKNGIHVVPTELNGFPPSQVHMKGCYERNTIG